MENKDQIISDIVIAVDHHIVKSVQQVIIFQLAFPQPHQKLLSSAGSFLCQWKFKL